MNTDAVTHAAVLEPHRRRTFALMRQHDGPVLILHDGTEIDLNGHTTLHQHLGQIGNGYYQGYLAHHSLAVNPADRSAFGLVHHILHVRATVPDDETQAQKRARQTHESLLWLRGVDALEAAPAGQLWVDVCDCLADTFEFYDQEDRLGRSYVIRAWQ